MGYDVVRYPDPTGSIGPHLLALLERTRVDCVLDVGAHWGAYGMLLRKAGYRGDIVSFEPVSSSASELEKRVGVDPRWSMHRVALGSRDGRGEMNVLRESDLASFLTTTAYGESEFPEATVLERRETVEIRRLDSLVEERRSRGGAEVLPQDGHPGLGPRGRRRRRRIPPPDRRAPVRARGQASLRGDASYLDALARFQELGFEPTGMFPVTRDRSLRVIEFDCVMTKADAWE
jgi:FkbM family methyltransferase